MRDLKSDADFNQAALVAGEEKAWERFIARFTRAVAAAVRRAPGFGAPGRGEAGDLVQDVFLKLFENDRRLLKTYDPTRAAPLTWLTLVARSIARDRLRASPPPSLPIETVPESALALAPQTPPEKLSIPAGLLSPRQELILSLLYDHEQEVGEIAVFLNVKPQTIRSMHHKALIKLRAYFAGTRPAGTRPDATGFKQDRRKNESP